MTYEVPDLVGIGEICQMLGWSRGRLHQVLREAADFPTPAAELSCGRIWIKTEVEQWMSQYPPSASGRRKFHSGPRRRVEAWSY